MLRILEELTFEEFARISQDWLRSGRLVWFVNGNITKESAVEVVEKGRHVFNLKAVDKEDLCEVRVLALNPGVTY